MQGFITTIAGSIVSVTVTDGGSGVCVFGGGGHAVTECGSSVCLGVRLYVCVQI